MNSELKGLKIEGKESYWEAWNIYKMLAIFFNLLVSTVQNQNTAGLIDLHFMGKINNTS